MVESVELGTDHLQLEKDSIYVVGVLGVPLKFKFRIFNLYNIYIYIYIDCYIKIE
jgi:hypothetical protein